MKTTGPPGNNTLRSANAICCRFRKEVKADAATAAFETTGKAVGTH